MTLPPGVPQLRSGCTPPPRVFWKKRLEVIENKGRRAEKENQETQRGCKSLKTRGLGLERRERYARLAGDNTTQGTTYLDVCRW